MKLFQARSAALFFVSVCVLAFEIEVMRVFSVASWSNFGSMVISIALLGFGLAGTLLTLLSARVRERPEAWLLASSFALGPSMAVAHVLAQRVPFNPVLITSDPMQLWWIGAYYLIYCVPFLAGGLFIGAAFVSLASRTHRLYFWNMLGSGLGGLLVLALMYVFPPQALIYPLVGLGAVPALLCATYWSPVEGRFRLRVREAALFVVLLGLSFVLLARWGALNVSDFKPISYARRYPDSAQVHTSFSPRGEQRVFSSSFFHFAPGLSDNASIGLASMPGNAFVGLFTDGNGPVGIMRKLEPDEQGYIDYLPMSAPYLLLTHPKVLILGLGGGAGVQTALYNGAREVRVVESNPDLIRLLRDVPWFRQYTGNALQDTRVKVTNAEVRAYAGATKEKFDLVEIGLVDSIGLSQAGGYSVEENYLYTVEAIRDYLRCLAPTGILSITVWDRLNPPRNVPKLLTTVAEAIRGVYEESPERRVFTFNLLLSTATILVKKSDFLPQEVGTLSDYSRRMSFDMGYYPDMPQALKSFDAMTDSYAGAFAPAARAANGAHVSPEAAPRSSDFYGVSVQMIAAGRQEELYARYVFDIRPATDDKPYYSGFIKPRTIPLLLRHLADISSEWGYLLLLGTFLQSLVFAALIIFLPLVFRGRQLFAGRRGNAGVIGYFACLGLGYMMAEVTLIQRFSYFLADPVFANAIVITVLLISSGFGSLASSALKIPRAALIRWAVGGTAALSAVYLVGLTPLLRGLLGLPLPLKALAALIVVAPMGFCLGIPFPSGLSALSEGRREILPWAWGVNGALSVTGSVLTRVVSMAAGFTVVLACVAALYLAAGFLSPANTGRAALRARAIHRPPQ
jgi:spermidine synthase